MTRPLSGPGPRGMRSRAAVAAGGPAPAPTSRRSGRRLRTPPLPGIGALASRLYVYASGFVALFLLAATVSPAQFGLYSVYQSVLEIALIVATLGSGLLFSRHAASAQAGVSRGDLVRTLALGLPLGLLAGAAILAVQGVPRTAWADAFAAATLAAVAFNSLRLAYGRGLGRVGLLNMEAGLRSTLMALAVGGAALLSHWMGRGGHLLALPQLLAINLLGALLIGGALQTAAGMRRPPPGPARLALGAQAGATLYALQIFLLRKADLLIVATFMPLTYVGAFKIAFLLAEAPSQFVQAWLYTRTPAMLAASGTDVEASVLRPARLALALGCALFAALAVLLAVAGPLLSTGPQVLQILLCIAPYFLLRTYTVHHEMLLALHAPMASLRRWAVLELALRLAAYALVLRLVPERPHLVFLPAFVVELAVYEWRMRARFGVFPLLALLGSRGRRPWSAP